MQYMRQTVNISHEAVIKIKNIIFYFHLLHILRCNINFSIMLSMRFIFNSIYNSLGAGTYVTFVLFLTHINSGFPTNILYVFFLFFQFVLHALPISLA
jgi:hypothetical protein